MTAWREVSLLGGTYGFAERPTVGHGVVAVGYSTDGSNADGDEPVVGIHDIDGSPGFTLRHESIGREIETGEPVIDDAGIVRAAVYEHDVELVVLAAYTDGTRLPPTSLGSEYPLTASDLGSKLRTQLAPSPHGGFVVTWCYRARQYFVGAYRDGAAEPTWQAAEWMIAATRAHVLCAEERDKRDPHEALVCRAKRDGAVAWHLAPGVVEVAAATRDAFLLVDRGDRHAEKLALAASADQRFLEGAITEAELERAWDGWPTMPTIVRLVDATSGSERWRAAIADDIFAAHATDDGLVSIMATDAHGAGRLYTNRTAASRAIPGHTSSAFPPAFGVEPVIVDHVDGHVVWADAASLHVARADALDAAVSLALPASIGGFRPRMHDRGIAKANAAVAAGHVYLRAGAQLWLAELPSLSPAASPARA